MKNDRDARNGKPVKRESYGKKKPSARKISKQARRRKKRRRILIGEISVLAVLLLVVFLWSKYNKINRLEIEGGENLELSEDTLQKMEKYTTIAVFGVDARDNKSLGKGTLADVSMICNINNETGEIRIVSVYRDSYLDVNGKEKFNKINAAYALGGPSQAVAALNRNLDMNIQDFVTLNWKGVADAINILGGVDLEVTEREFRDINGLITETVETTGVGSVHLKAPGYQHLDGIQAVAYTRIRKIDTDYKRTERQREVLGLLMQKAKTADIGTLLRLVDIIFPQVMTSLSNTEIISLAKDISKYHIGETAGFPFDKNEKIMGKAGDCVIPLGLAQNVSQLHKFLYENEEYQVSNTVLRLDQLIKDATGYGEPGTPTKAVVKTTSAAKATTAPPKTTQETTPEETAAEEMTKESTVPETSPESGSETAGESAVEKTTEAPISTEVPASIEKPVETTTQAPTQQETAPSSIAPPPGEGGLVPIS